MTEKYVTDNKQLNQKHKMVQVQERIPARKTISSKHGTILNFNFLNKFGFLQHLKKFQLKKNVYVQAPS